MFVFDLREVSPMPQWIINQEVCKPVLDKFTPEQQELIEKMAIEIEQELEADHG